MRGVPQASSLRCGSCRICRVVVSGGVWCGSRAENLCREDWKFLGYFDRILNLDTGQRVWTDPAEWFWGWQKWLKLLAETLLLSYVGTTIGAVGAFGMSFFAAAIYRRIRRCDSLPAGCWSFAERFPASSLH
jgi:hypothetical protein